MNSYPSPTCIDSPCHRSAHPSKFWRSSTLATALLLVVALLVGTPASAMSQDDETQGRSARGGQFQLMREVLRDCPRKEILDLLRIDEVREHLGLKQELFDEISSLDRDSFNDTVKILQGNHDDSKKKWKATKRITEYCDAAYELLDKELGITGIERLDGLFAQARGPSAAANGRIAEKIGLAGSELDQFRALSDELFQEMRGLRSHISRIYANPRWSFKEKSEKIRKLFDAHREKTADKLTELLTPEQNTALIKLQGEEFKFEQRPRSGRPPRNRRSEGDSDDGNRDDCCRDDRCRDSCDPANICS